MWRTPERDAAVRAYEYVQIILMIIALVFSVPLLLSVLFMRDRPLDDKVARDDVSESGLSSAATTDDRRRSSFGLVQGDVQVQQRKQLY